MARRPKPTLLDSPAPVKRYTDGRDRGGALRGRSSSIGQSEREWMQIQSTLESNRELAATSNQAIQELGDENDEAFMNVDQLRGVIARKEALNERKRTDALAVQEKFIWDLALAVKRCLVDEKGQTTINGVAISQLAVQSVLNMAETEDPEPDAWCRWIEGKFVQQIA
jgi:hypothetical protein